jgi:hypothetical protein
VELDAQGVDKALSVEHTSTFHAVNNIDHLYKDQGNMSEAEVMLLQALGGYKQQ